MLEERQSSTVVNQYVWSIAYVNTPVLRDDNSTGGSYGKTSSGLGRRIYVQTDANDNVTALTNTSGVVQQRFDYTPYGIMTVIDGTTNWSTTTDSYSWAYTFQGERYDATVGMLHFGAREYSPSLGRWVQKDAEEYVDGMNLYKFVDATPVDATDPTGFKCKCGTKDCGCDNKPSPPAGRVPGTEARELNVPPNQPNGVTLSIDEAIRQMDPPDTMKNTVRDMVNTGCVGLCRVYIGPDAIIGANPEGLPNAHAFRNRDDAQKRVCPCGYRPFVFAIQGQWRNGEPQPDKNGEVPVNSIDISTGVFNYITAFQNGLYAWMTGDARSGGKVIVSRRPLTPNNMYPHEIWVSTCLSNKFELTSPKSP